MIYITAIKKINTNIFIDNKSILTTILYYCKTKSKTNKNSNIINYTNLSYHNILYNKSLYIISKSKGKGFCGTIKKHNFKSNKQSHGNSKAHNKPGSIGMCQTPGRLLKGKKMAGILGNNTIKYKKIIPIFNKNNIIIIKGSIAGNKKQSLIINEQ